MSSPSTDDLVLPRPDNPNSSKSSIPGPSEEAFTSTFGTLLPSAKYLNLEPGKAAYYDLPPSNPPTTSSTTPNRVLLIHGVQTPALGLLPLTRALQTAFPTTHFALFDHWGHGLSDTPIVPFVPALFHDLIDAVLDELNWPSAHVIGYSFGGSLTAGYVASRPERMQSFTLVAPAGLIHSADFDDAQRAHLRGEDEVAARKWVIEFLEGGELVVPADWKERVARGEVVAEAVREWQMRENPGHGAAVVAVVRDGGALDNDAAFEKAVASGIPSVVVLGELDGVCSEQQIRDIGFKNVAVVPAIGHGVVRERAEDVAGIIGQFWKNLD